MRSSAVIGLAASLVAFAAQAREAVRVEEDFLASLKRAAKEDGEQASAMLKAATDMVRANVAEDPPARVSRRIAELKSQAKGEERLKTIRDLARLGEPALFALSELLLSGDEDAASAIASVGSKLGTLALVQGLRGGTPKVRLACVPALAGLADARALPFLRESKARAEKTARASRTEEADFTFECEDAIGAIEKANLPPEKKKLEEALDALEEELYAVLETSFGGDFRRSAAGARKVLPKAVALARAHPESERAREFADQIRRVVMNDGADTLCNEIEEEGVDELRELGIEVVAWLERSSLRVAVANFGKKRRIDLKLGFVSGTRGAGGRDETFVESCSGQFELGRGEARLVRFLGIPKRPRLEKKKYVRRQPACFLTAKGDGRTLRARILPQGYSEDSVAWDCREYVVRGESVGVDFHPIGEMLVHVQNRFISRSGKEFPCSIQGKGRIREAEHGWFVEGGDFAVTVSFKGLKRPDVVSMRDIFARVGNGMVSEFVARGPRTLAVAPRARVRTTDVELPASRRLDASPLSDDPKKRAEELAMRVRWPVWNAAREAVEEIAGLDQPGVSVLAGLATEDLDWRAEETVRRALAETKPRGAIDHLVRRLGDRSSDAVRALTAIGGAAVEPLLKVLREGNADARASALIALGGIGSKHPSDRIAEAVKACLDDADKHVRQRAAEALATIKPPGAVEALARRLREESDEDVRTGVVIALGGMKDRSAARALIERLEVPDETEHVKEFALSSLGELGAKEATPACARILEAGSPELRKSALWAMRHFADERAADALIAQFDDMDPEIRWAAARVLGRTGAKKAIDPLLEALADEDETVRSYAARSLRELGVEVEERGHKMYFVPEPPRRMRKGMRKKSPAELVELFATEDWQARRCALEEVIRRKRTALPHLLRAAADGRAQLRLYAVQALMRVGGRDAISRMAGLLDDPDVQVRRKTAELLAKVKDPSLRNAWARANASDDWFVRARAAEALGAFGGADIAADLRKAIFDPRKETRIHAIRALGRMRDVEAVPLLMEALWGKTERAKTLYGYRDYRPKPKGQVLAIRDALVSIGAPAAEQVVELFESRWGDHTRLTRDVLLRIGEPARPALLKAVRSGDRDLVEGAAWVFGSLGGKGTAGMLFGLVEQGHSVRNALIAMGSAAKPECREMLKSGTPKQKAVAAFVLVKLGDRSGVNVLLEQLKSDDPKGRYENAWMLKEVCTQAELPVLIEALKDPYCSQQVVLALEGIGDERAVPALKSVLFRTHGYVGAHAARIIFEMTGERCRYLDGDGCVQLRGEKNPQAPTAVEAGLVGGKPTVRFNFEDGTAMGWQAGEPAQKPARGKCSLSAPPHAAPRFMSPDLAYEIGRDSWFSMRAYSEKRVIICVRFHSDAGREFQKAFHHEGKGWQGFACPLVGVHVYGQHGTRSKPGDAIVLIRMRVQSRSAREIPLYLDDVMVTGGEGGVAEPEEPQDQF